MPGAVHSFADGLFRCVWYTGAATRHTAADLERLFRAQAHAELTPNSAYMTKSRELQRQVLHGVCQDVWTTAPSHAAVAEERARARRERVAEGIARGDTTGDLDGGANLSLDAVGEQTQRRDAAAAAARSAAEFDRALEWLKRYGMPSGMPPTWLPAGMLPTWTDQEHGTDAEEEDRQAELVATVQVEVDGADYAEDHEQADPEAARFMDLLQEGVAGGLTHGMMIGELATALPLRAVMELPEVVLGQGPHRSAYSEALATAVPMQGVMEQPEAVIAGQYAAAAGGGAAPMAQRTPPRAQQRDTPSRQAAKRHAAAGTRHDPMVIDAGAASEPQPPTVRRTRMDDMELEGDVQDGTAPGQGGRIGVGAQRGHAGGWSWAQQGAVLEERATVAAPRVHEGGGAAAPATPTAAAPMDEGAANLINCSPLTVPEGGTGDGRGSGAAAAAAPPPTTARDGNNVALSSTTSLPPSALPGQGTGNAGIPDERVSIR